VKLWLVLQCVHKVGSAILPLSTSTVADWWHTEQRKKASHISGMRFEVRITMPLIVIS
jgi:hypothetical protein